jgi:hypothetical protein
MVRAPACDWSGRPSLQAPRGQRVPRTLSVVVRAMRRTDARVRGRCPAASTVGVHRRLSTDGHGRGPQGAHSGFACGAEPSPGTRGSGPGPGRAGVVRAVQPAYPRTAFRVPGSAGWLRRAEMLKRDARYGNGQGSVVSRWRRLDRRYPASRVARAAAARLPRRDMTRADGQRRRTRGLRACSWIRFILLSCTCQCRDVPVCADADRVYGAGLPGAAGPYRDIRASTEPARMAIGLDQSAETDRRGRRTMLSPEVHNVTAALRPACG